MANGNKNLGEMNLLEILQGGAQTAGQMVNQQVTQDNPVAVLARLLGGLTASNPLTTPTQDVAQNVVSGVGKPQPQVPELSLRKTKALEKVVTKGINEQAEEFVSMQGLSAAEEILEKIDQQPQAGTQAVAPPAASQQGAGAQGIASALAPQAPAQAPAPTTSTPTPGQGQDQQQDGGGIREILGKILSLGGLIQTHPNLRLAQSQAALNEQQLAGEVPLQKGEREKLTLQGLVSQSKEETKRFNTFFDSILTPKPLSEGQSKSIELLSSAQGSLNKITEIFNQDPTLLQTIATPGNQLGQTIRFHTENLANNLLRRESGAAIKEDERKFFNKLVTPRGMKAFLENPQVTLEKIQSIGDRISTGLNLLRPNKKMNEFVKSSLKQGFSKEEVFQFLKQKGMI